MRYITSGKCEDSSNVVLITVQPVLAGFGISGTDTICYNTAPIQQTATGTATGGNGATYTYSWIQSTNNTTWQYTGSSGVNLKTYQPFALTDTTWYSYVLTSGSCIDTSASSRILVMPQIINNITSYDSIICENLSPAIFNDPVATGGWGSFAYKWQTSLNDVSYTDAPGTNNQRQYTSGALTQTTYFRRIAYSPLTSTENCQAIGNRDVRITVLPKLSNVEISGWPVLQNCYNTQLTLNGNRPSGGQAGSYTYTWEENPDTNNAGGWIAAGGTTLNGGEDFRTIQLTDSIYFRRFVASGLHNTCQATSKPVKVHINSLPSGELVSFEDTTCSNSEVFLHVINIAGNGPFALYISNSIDTFDIYNSSVDLATYPTSLVLPNQLYNYAIDSLVDVNHCKAVDKPGEVNILVYQVPESVIPDTTKACGSIIQLSATPSVGLGTWAGNDLDFTDINDPEAEATLTADLNNVFLTDIAWTEVNGICSDFDQGTLVFYKQPEIAIITDSLIGSKIFDEAKVTLEAQAPDAGQGTWSTPNSAPVIEDIHNTTTNVTNLGEFGEYLFFWTVENGICEMKFDSISIFSYDITAPTGFSPNNDDINDQFVIRGLDPEKGLDYGLIVFDRWGQMVYEAEDYANDWDGRSESGKDLPEDTYFFILKLSDGRDYKGFVVIKR
jgi:gliding motility-associated-like protein